MMRPFAHSFLFAALALLLASCSWFRGSDAREKRSPLVEFTPTATAQVAWQAQVGKKGNALLVPAVWQGNVYAASSDGQAAAYDANNGQPRWRVDVGERVSAGVGRADGSVLLGTRKGEVIALNASGRELWRSQLSSEILVAPQGSAGTVIARTADGKTFGLATASGMRLWTQSRTNPALVLRNLGDIVIASGTAYAGFPGGKLLAVNLNNGSTMWEGSVAIPRGATELERVADVVTAPALDDERVCAVAYQGRLACFDVVKGSVDWARDVSSARGLAQDGRNLYVADDLGHVLAFKKSDGESVWKQDRLQGRELSGPALFERYVVVGDVEGFVHVLAAANGELVARVATDGSAIAARPALTDNGLIVQTRNGNLFAIAIE